MIPIKVMQRIPPSGGGSGSLSLAGSGSGAGTIDISTGKADWALWGIASSATPSQTKSGGGATISAGIYGAGAVLGYNADPRTLTWTGGTPTASGSHTDGIYNDANDAAGGSLTGMGVYWLLPASTSSKTARVCFGVYEGVAQYTASLSDASASPLAGSSILSAAAGNANQGYLDFTYAAASAGQTLLVRVFLQTANGGYANISLNGANVV